MRINNVYRREFLLGELVASARVQDKDSFVTFQGRKLLELVEPKLFDFLAVNILRLKPDGMPNGELVGAAYNVSEAVIASYEKNLLADDFTPTLFSNPGSALFNDAVRPMDEWIDRPVYTNHCNIFDYHRVCGIAYNYPFHSQPKIVMFISEDKTQTFPSEVNEEVIEYIFFPFYLGWLHVYRLIDEATLSHWLQLLGNMSLPRFRVMRALFEPITLSAKTLADHLGLSSSGIYAHLEGAMENLMNLRPHLQEKKGNLNRLAELIKAYRFFEFAPGSVRRNLPRRSEQDW